MRNYKQYNPMMGAISKQMDKISSGGDARFFSNVERQTPIRPPDLTADALVPLAQMGVCAVGAFCIVFPIAAFIVGPVGGLAVATVVAGVAAGVATIFVLDWNHATLYSTEMYRDNLTATAQTSAETVTENINLTVRREDINETFPPLHSRILPIDTERFMELAKSAIAGYPPLTQSEWVGSDKPFSRSEFDETAAMLMELGILAWRSERDPAQGRIVTAGGRHALMACMDGRMQIGGE